jgi:hypothetical protein
MKILWIRYRKNNIRDLGMSRRYVKFLIELALKKLGKRYPHA